MLKTTRSFCRKERYAINHIFWCCSNIKLFWEQLQTAVNERCVNVPSIKFNLLPCESSSIRPEISDVFEQTQVGDSFKCRSENVLPAIIDTAGYTLVTLRKLLLRAGDTEANPGPSRTDTRSDLCIIHLNARSIKNKIDLIEAEANQFDIITVSETWFSQIDMNTSIHLTNFHPPIRRDRPNDPHAGVAHICKK